MAEKIKYSFLVGIWKSLKNVLIVLAPAFIAFLMNVPLEYTPVASLLIYLLKNYVENR